MDELTFNSAHVLIAVAVGYCLGYAHGYLTKGAVK